jgi:CMP-N,N'-diacetyllegionaminic acid synthase
MAEGARPRVVGIIPARGGSSEVSGKNLRIVAGKPLIWYTVDAARRATTPDLVVVSTEDPEISDYARSLGVMVFNHPAELSGQDAPTFPVIQWDLSELHRREIAPDICVVMRATSPLRTADDIDRAVAILARHPQADSVVSVARATGIHPIRLKRVLSDNRLADAFPDVFGPEGSYPKRRQELEALYLRNGAVYAAKSSVVAKGGLWGSHCLAYEMPQERSININTETDLLLAELVILHSRSKSHAH